MAKNKHARTWKGYDVSCRDCQHKLIGLDEPTRVCKECGSKNLTITDHARLCVYGSYGEYIARSKEWL